jgi:hypothetical protein
MIVLFLLFQISKMTCVRSVINKEGLTPKPILNRGEILIFSK